MPRHLVPKSTTVGFALIVLLILVNLAVSEWNIRRLNENDDRVVRTHQVLTTLEEVLSGVTEAETGERGFLITGDVVYSQSYAGAVARTKETLEHLAALTRGNARQQSQVVALRDRVQVRFDELRQAIAAHRSGGFEAARVSVSSNQGRRLMNEMRRLVSEMQTQERAALATRSDESRNSEQMTTVSDRIGALLGIGMVGLAFVLFTRELVHRERADDAVRRLAAIVESSDDAIVSKTLDGLIVSWNAGARRIYGYTVDDVIGHSVTMLCPPERVEEVEENLQHVRRGVHVEHYETTRVRKDGRRINVSLTISPIKSAAGDVIGASAIGRDITAHKTQERELLDTAAREQRRIGQDLHDDTGQQLTGLAMMTQRLVGELTASGLPQAAIATRIVDGLEQVLGHVRALSKGLVPVEVDAEGLMASLLDLVSRTSISHAVDCTFQCDEPVCILDNQTATHLYRMSQEAVTNAVKHGHAHKIAINLTSKLDLVILTITDDGSGFPATQPQTDGSGLRIMRYRAGLLGAKLSIDPVEPHGTRVTCMVASRQVGQHWALTR